MCSNSPTHWYEDACTILSDGNINILGFKGSVGYVSGWTNWSGPCKIKSNGYGLNEAITHYSLKLHVGWKPVHWTTWGSKTKHCDYNGLLVMKQSIVKDPFRHGMFTPPYYFWLWVQSRDLIYSLMHNFMTKSLALDWNGYNKELS